MEKSSLLKGFNPLKVALIYFFVGILWILFSDLFLEITFKRDTVIELQTYKGWFFITITAILVFILTNKLIQAIEEKSNNEYRLNNVLDELNHLVTILDPQFKIVDTNKISCEIINIDKKDLIGKEFWDTPWFSFDEEYALVVKDLLQRAKSGKTIESEGYLIINNQTLYSKIYIKPIFQNDKLINIMIEGENITELKATQKNLENLNRDLEKKIQERTEDLNKKKVEVEYINNIVKDVEKFAKIGYWEINLSNNHRFWSDGICKIFGLERVENINNLISLIPTEKQNILIDSLDNLYNNKNASAHIIYPVILKNGTIKYLETIAKRVDKNGEEIIVGTDRDISKKYLLEEKQRIQEKLIQKQKREAYMGKLVSDIAHHWRQPLNIIGLIIQNIYDSFTYNELTQESLNKDVQKALNQLRSLSKTIDIFSNLTKEQEEEKRFLITDAIERSLEKLSKKKELDPELKINSNYTINGDMENLATVIENLLENSLESIEKNQKKNIIIETTKKDKNILITISDNGSGIKEEILERMFDPYTTTKLQGGIGLFISKIFIENYFNGKIYGENINNGSRFTIEIPM